MEQTGGYAIGWMESISSFHAAARAAPTMRTILCRGCGETYCLQFENKEDNECNGRRDVMVRVSDVLRVLKRRGVREIEEVRLYDGRKELRDEDAAVPSRIEMRRRGLRGGKGGFGAMLKASGKGGGGKRTKDFGACRDLNGRRLRHVNNEIALRRWRRQVAEKKRAKERGERYEGGDIGKKTKSGIEGWYLGVPTWADMPGGGKRARRDTYKTAICQHWLKAREDRDPPAGAPRWWGCSSGRRCKFAHGPEELRDDAKIAYERERSRKRRAEKDRKMREYTASAVGTSVVEATLSAVESGLRRAAKRVKTTPSTLSKEDDSSARQTNSTRTKVAESFQDGDPIHIGDGGRIEGRGNFVTLRLGSSEIALRRGCWYYEVTLLTEGLMQIGWAENGFVADSEKGDGVGDDAHSWSFDGFRARKWHSSEDNEDEKDGESSYGKRWRVGDVVGCALRVMKKNAARLEFFLNGESMGVAFRGVPTNDGLFPVISMNGDEAVRVNIGQIPFTYPLRETGSRGIVAATLSDSESLAELPVEITAASSRLSAATDNDAPHVEDAKASNDTNSGADVGAIDIEGIVSKSELAQAFNADAIKAELIRRRLKCGGTFEQRVDRLWSVRGLTEEEVRSSDASVEAKKKRKKRRRKN